MSSVTLLPQSRPLCRHDLASMPDDGHRYEQAGCPSYWVLDPETPSLTAWDLTHGAYALTAQVAGQETFSATRPFAVQLRPAGLIV